MLSHHFSRIANDYRNLRTTDSAPIAFIAKELEGLRHVDAADIGCGDGRYDLLLYNWLGDKLRLACVDANTDMLTALDSYLREQGITFTVVNSTAEGVALPTASLDCVFTFNAVHHFDLRGFLLESSRLLRSGGYLFIYTRLQDQNSRNIWGQFFPQFCEKETRLYHLSTFLQTWPGLWLEAIEYFRYERSSTPEQLVARARAHHYSTFWLYSPEELEEAIRGFQGNIERNFDHQIKWFDENVLVVFRRTR